MAGPSGEETIDMDDLQAAIDASAQATVESKAKPIPVSETELATEPEQAVADATPEETEIAVEPVKEATPEEPTEETPAEAPTEISPEPEASEEHTVAVKIKKSSSGLKTKKAAGSEGDEDEAPARETLMSRRGKTIQPLSVQAESEEADEPADEQPPEDESAKEEPAEIAPEEPPKAEEPTEAPESESTAAEISAETNEADSKEEEPAEEAKEASDPESTTEDKAEPAKTESLAGGDGFKLNGLETKNNAKEVENGEEADQNKVKVYDTKEYHLPIKANKHHKAAKGIPTWFFIAAAALIAAGGAGFYFFL